MNRRDFRPNDELSINPHVKKYNEWNREDNSKKKIELAKAINERGYTKNSNEGGYILENGEMLDFSGRNNAVGYKNRKPINPSGIGKADYLANNRSADHREIGNYVNTDEKDNESDMQTFIRETGAIRMNDSGDLYLEFHKKPSYRQKATIRRIKSPEGIIVVDRWNNGKLESKEYKTFEEFDKDN